MSDKSTAILFAALVALFWGLYGPALTNARSPIKEWSVYKPFVFVGLAYLVIGVIGGAVMMKIGGDTFDISGSKFPAAKWGFIAGALGAIGALFLTYAVVKTGGKPALVMPIVFGGAVTVNAIVSYLSIQDRSHVSPLLWVGMGLVAVGIYFVASNAPHGKPGAKAVTAEEPVIEQADTPAPQPETV